MLALNISAFPEELPVEDIAQILAAAAEVVEAAGGSVAGGHTIRSAEPVFGLAVQGLVHPDRIWTKRGARPGDRLVLSKPVGSGIVLAGADEASHGAAISVMRSLNRTAAGDLAALADRDGRPAAHAVTDVTGFGLAGHSWEIADRSGVGVSIRADAIPLYAGAADAAARGVRTGGDARNRAYLGEKFRSRADSDLEALAVDPQTSGGLLASVHPDDAAALCRGGWWDIGEVTDGPSVVTLA